LDAAVCERCVGGGGAATLTTTSRALASRSKAFGILAEWLRQAALPQITCSPGTCQRRQASVANLARLSAILHPSSLQTRASGRGTR